MMVVNNEMVMEHGQRAVALRDERMAEMQLAINELTASLSRKDDIIAAKDSATRDHFAKVRDMANMAQKKDDEYLWKHNELQMEIRSLMKLNENEVASREWHEERFIEEKNEYRRFRHTELQAFKDRAVSVEAVKDELMDENMKLIESNNQLRTRVAELLGSRLSIGGDETSVKVIEELHDELHKANQEINRLQEGIECNPNLD
jgi:CRISPR/Cas system-associated endonuclease Cas3-HD